jgi:hypothetical protein
VSPDVRAARRTASERGTSTLEVAGLAPLVLIVAFALVNAGFVLYGISAAQTAARQAARAYSLGQDPHAAASAALPRWLGSDVTTFSPGHGVRVRVDLPDLVPGTDLSVTREAVMP